MNEKTAFSDFSFPHREMIISPQGSKDKDHCGITAQTVHILCLLIPIFVSSKSLSDIGGDRKLFITERTNSSGDRKYRFQTLILPLQAMVTKDRKSSLSGPQP